LNKNSSAQAAAAKRKAKQQSTANQLSLSSKVQQSNITNTKYHGLSKESGKGKQRHSHSQKWF